MDHDDSPQPNNPPPLPPSFLQKAREEIDAKAKPPGSLGRLEDWAVKIASIQRTLKPHIAAARLCIFAADHGVTVTHPGVSAYPREVTIPIFHDISMGTGASALLSKGNDCELDLIDVGMDCVEGEGNLGSTNGGEAHIRVTRSKVRRSSRDMTTGPALSPKEREAAQAVGAAAVRRYIAAHVPPPPPHGSNEEDQDESTPHSRLVLCIGELGIGNTTAAAALVAALTGKDPALVTGKGTGLHAEGVNYKAQIIAQALAVNQPLIETGDPTKILEAVGGLEMAAMVGAYLEAGRHRMPMIVDGFVSGAAALVALYINPSLAAYLFWSHQSDERGALILLDQAMVKTQEAGEPFYSPPLMMNLRLGEGTGALLALPLLRSACTIMREMVTLESVVKKG